MTLPEPPDEFPGLAAEWRENRAAASTRDRVYEVALQLHEPTRVREVADRADVAKETARDYLRWFAHLGVLDQVGESPDAFVRNERYFEWRRIQRLRSRPEEELTDRLGRLTEKEREFAERYGTDGPADVDALEHAEYGDVETVWLDLQEWRTVRRRIRELERARRSGDESERTPA